MKKKLLFVQESLTLAGGEKSLIALLSNLDPSKYEIDLQLFRFGGALDAQIPKYVNILEPIPYTEYAATSWKNNLSMLLRGKGFRYFYSKLRYSVSLRSGRYNHPEKAQIYWEGVRRSIENNPNHYDVAIAYAQGVPTFYVSDKVNAKKKVAWVNVNLKLPPKNKFYNWNHYQKFDNIVAVSSNTVTYLNDLFPDFHSKFLLIEDMLDYRSISKLSQESPPTFRKNDFNILTVARLNYLQKGYDIALGACKILHDHGSSFKWYVIGEGPYEAEMRKFIADHFLDEVFILLGTKSNPYPYFKDSNLYVQTSRHEGFGLSIAEARLLNIPVVTTRYDSVDVQMIHEQNGLITDLNAEAVAEAIERIMTDTALYQSIVENLNREPKENTETVQKFDEMIEILLSQLN